MNIGRKRFCSCCGGEYTEWKEQDIEGNNCQKCTFWGLRREVSQYKKSIELLCSKLNPENAKQLSSMPFYKQRIMVDQAFEDNVLTFSVS